MPDQYDSQFNGTNGDDWVIGNNYTNDILFGYDGNDLLYSGDGDDYVDGGDGNDTIIGGSGAGDDIYIGGNGEDEIIYTSATHSITVDLSQGYAYGADIGNDTLFSIENITGGSGDDILIGDENDNDISGAEGNDQIFGLGGNDFLNGDEGDDHIEGGDGNDTLNGGIGNDTLIGGDGADFMDGGAGDDILMGNDGDDFLIGSLGNDIIDGGAGSDFLFYGLGSQDITVNLMLGIATGVEIGTDTISNIEFIQGGNGNDSYTGDTLDNVFIDHAGGADTYYFGFNQGDDRITDISNDGTTDVLMLDPFTTVIENTVFSQSGNDLVITDTQQSGSITLDNYFGSIDSMIETIKIRFVKDLDQSDVQDILANGGMIPNTFLMIPPEIVPEISNVYTNITGTDIEHEFTIDTQVFPDLTDKTRLEPDSLKNGVDRENLTLQNDHNVKVNFITESSGSKNSLGMYTIGPNGEIQDIQILVENLSGTGEKKFGGGDFNPGDLAADLGTVTAGTEIGFFLLKGGANKFKKLDLDNGSFRMEVKKTGEPATTDNVGKELKLIFTDDTTGKDKKIGGKMLHASFDNLNKDEDIHTVSGINENGNLSIGFEEAKAKKGDFEDTVIEIVFEPSTVSTLADVPITSGFIITDTDDNTLTSASIDLTNGIQAGDILKIDNTLVIDGSGLIQGTNITFTQTSDLSIDLSGADSVENYKMVLEAIKFNTSQSDPLVGIREISFEITDLDGIQTLATSQVHIGAIDPVIQGSTADDVLVSTIDSDLMIGGLGEDLFVLTNLVNPDTIQDFDISGDRIDIHDLLTGFDPLQDDINSFVSLNDTGTDTILQINTDGSAGSAFDTAVTLQGLSGVTLTDLVNADSLVLA